MSHSRRPPVVATSTLLLTLALTACGGGGGGGGSSTGAAPAAATPAPAPAPAASSVAQDPPPAPAPAPAPAASEPPAAGSVACAPGDAPATRSAAFSFVNMVRSVLGLRPLVRLAAFDGTAQAHAQYVVANGSSGAEESPGLPCFSGTDLAQRFAGAGVVSATLPGGRARGEIVVGYVTPGTELQPWDLVNNTLHNLYSRMFLLDPRAEQVGLGFSARLDGPQRAMVLDAAALPGAVEPAEVWAVWPRDGTTGLPARMPTSNIKPLDASLTEGYPASLHATAPVQVSRFVISNASDGQPVAATVLTQANDRNGFLTEGEAAVVPHAPLAAATTYRVELDGSAGATPLHLSWSFTTAP